MRLGASGKSVDFVEVVAHTGFFGVHVKFVVVVGGDFYGHVLDDFEAVAFEADALDGIVGHKLHLFDAEKVEYLGADTIITLVGLMTEMDIRLDGIKTLFLKFICPDLFHQTDAAALLIEIDHSSPALTLYHLHGFVELLAAIASQ